MKHALKFWAVIFLVVGLAHTLNVRADESGRTAAAPLELSLAGRTLTDAELYSIARKSFYKLDWEVINAQGGVITAKIKASRWTAVPVNDQLQWDEPSKMYIYRAEVRVQGTNVVVAFIPSWGATSDKLLRELRKELAERLY